MRLGPSTGIRCQLDRLYDRGIIVLGLVDPLGLTVPDTLLARADEVIECSRRRGDGVAARGARAAKPKCTRSSQSGIVVQPTFLEVEGIMPSGRRSWKSWRVLGGELAQNEGYGHRGGSAIKHGGNGVSAR